MNTEDPSHGDPGARIRRIADEALDSIARWRMSPAWQRGGVEDLAAAADEVTALLARLGPGAGTSAIRAVVAPLLGRFWPRDPGPALIAADAVDQLWLACLHGEDQPGSKVDPRVHIAQLSSRSGSGATNGASLWVRDD